MGRNLDRRDRCQKCLMKNHVCICSFLVPFFESDFINKTLVSILMHNRETVTTTNTARFALKLLPYKSLHLRGLIDDPLDPKKILSPNHTPLYLYPSDSAVSLTKDFINNFTTPIQLIVPDGSWRQAKKFSRRESWLSDIQHVKLDNTQNSIFFLRRKVKQEGVSTYEAISRALETLESQKIREKMDAIFKVIIERTLLTRGKKLENYL